VNTATSIVLASALLAVLGSLLVVFRQKPPTFWYDPLDTFPPIWLDPISEDEVGEW
jgi:hypothetical protein